MSLAPPYPTAPPLSSHLLIHPLQFHHHNLPFSSPHTFPFFWKSSRSNISHVPVSRVLLRPPLASISTHSYEGIESSAYDPELRSVLQLATDSELYELERILFGPSYFSPLLKSVTKRADVDHIMIGEDPDEREDFISTLESRFLFLAADARSTLSEETGSFSSSRGNPDVSNNLEVGLSQWKVQKLAALRIGATELRPMILKGGGMLTLEKAFEFLGGRLTGKMVSEAAKYQMKKEFVKKGAQLAAINLESGAALLAAKQGLKVAATRYLGLRSVVQLLGPMMWGTLLADVVIQMLGTDYARILRAIYAFAQIRIYRSHKTVSETM